MYTVAIAGVTGAVGRVMLEVLEERSFPVDKLVPLASERSRGEIVHFDGEALEVEVLSERDFSSIDIALFSAGSGVVNQEVDRLLDQGTVVVDNSSAFRYDPEVPLVVPEVNSEDLRNHNGLVANPNCSTTQLVMPLAPLHETYEIQRITVSTYQATSGAGARAEEEMWEESRRILDGEDIDETEEFPHQIAFNAIPEIGPVLEEEHNYTKEEMKMVWETRKILGDSSLDVSPTAVRIPVAVGHGESVNVEFNREFNLQDVRERLENYQGIVVRDDPTNSIYPTMINTEGRDAVYVGRIRRDPTLESGLNFWIVSDNLRKGAALNTVQIAETLIENKLLSSRPQAAL